MWSTLEMLLLLLLHIVLNTVIGNVFRCKEHKAGDAPCRGWQTFWPFPGPAVAMMPLIHQLSDVMVE